MDRRNAFLIGVAAGAVAGGVTWLLARQRGEVGPVEELHMGEPFPSVSGVTLAGEPRMVPDDLAGKVGLLILAFDYAARYEVEAWSREVMSAYGEQPEMAIYLMPMISGVGPFLRAAVDAAMVRGTPTEERSHVLTIYGDLRWLRKRLGIGEATRAHVFLLGRTGRVVWRADGPPTNASLGELSDALGMQGITLHWKPA